MKIKNIWETYFFKKRYIMGYKKEINNFNNICFSSMSSLDLESLLNQVDVRFAKYLLMRKNDPSWIVFYYKINKKILGYSFLHAPRQEEWNDSLPTSNKEARVSTDFVYPEHRGKGILGEITKCQIKYSSENNLKLWCVIESSNISAMRASYENKFIERSNYLIKIFGINFISIVTNPFRVSILLGQKRARR